MSHGSGSWTNTSTVAQATAKPPSTSVIRGGSAVAEISTGPRNRNANGFCSPPVRNSSTASSAMSKARSQAARSGSSRCVIAEAHAQRDIEPGRQRDHREAGPDRQLEVEPEIHHQHGGGLADHREPAQPHQRIETHAAPGPVGLLGGLLGHATMYAFGERPQPRRKVPDRWREAPPIPASSSRAPLAPRSSRRHMCGLAQPPVGYAQSRRARHRR